MHYSYECEDGFTIKTENVPLSGLDIYELKQKHGKVIVSLIPDDLKKEDNAMAGKFIYTFEDGKVLEFDGQLPAVELTHLIKIHGAANIIYKEGLKTEEGCKYCDTNRDDWTFDIEKYDFGGLGKYDLSLSIVPKDPSILVEFGKIGGQNIIFHKFEGIKFCPYCGRKLV